VRAVDGSVRWSTDVNDEVILWVEETSRFELVLDDPNTPNVDTVKMEEVKEREAQRREREREKEKEKKKRMEKRAKIGCVGVAMTWFLR
jgi:hypothetical protein